MKRRKYVHDRMKENWAGYAQAVCEPVRCFWALAYMTRVSDGAVMSAKSVSSPASYRW